MDIPYVMRKCNKCGRWLVLSDIRFSKDKQSKYGLKRICKDCRNKYQRERRKNNIEEIREKEIKYRATRKERISELNHRNYLKHKEQIIERHKKYYSENKEKVKEYRRLSGKRHYLKVKDTPEYKVKAFNNKHKRRLKEETQGKGITKEQWVELMSFFDWKCAYSGKSLGRGTRSIDHITPLNKGGFNEIWNTVPMYMPYNSSKCDRDMLEWYIEQPFFSEERLKKIYEWQNYAYNKYGRENLTEAE